MLKSLKIIKKIAFILCIFILLVDILGFVRIFKMSPSDINQLSNIDGIVVFTGGENRVKTAVELLSVGIANHLFISGVNPGTNKYNISKQMLSDFNLIDCCIDLGRNAKNTFENALETANWIEENEYKKIIIVTSDYHMKRSLHIIKNFSKSTNFFPHHVQSKILNDMNITKFEKLRIVLLEYSKYLYTRLRLLFEFNQVT
ncbi:MAG: hypothetical protein CBB88_06590 [Rhizobiales bacterium TMED28]|nr:hypothetical protein [Rhodobiaceae bacterium]OUT81906.1 MAG: hypothetical protein CBB88_06590 [Rhizobiales bacterium TMED28]